MSSCLRGREVRVVLRNRRDRRKHRVVNIVCPAGWSKSALLRYVRGEHPEATVRVARWWPTGNLTDVWTQRLWIANPDGFLDYARGVREGAETPRADLHGGGSATPPAEPGPITDEKASTK